MVFFFPKSLCGFCRQHRRKFIFVGVFVGGVYGIIKFVEYKIKEHILQEQKKMQDGLKVQKSFEQVQVHSLRIVSAMLQEVRDCVKQHLNAEEITAKLKAGSGDKIALWHELKITVFSGIVTAICSVVLVSLVLQIQLNQVAGLMFHQAGDGNAVDSRQQNFLSVIHDHIVHHGIYELARLVKKVATDQLHSMPLQAMYNGVDLQTTINSICHGLFKQLSFDKAPVKLIQFAIGERLNLDDWTVVQSEVVNDVNTWVAKTVDILESPDFLETVSSLCIDKGVLLVGREITCALALALESSQYENVAPLAKLLPILNAQLPVICSQDFVKEIYDVSLLKKFMINVHESFVAK